MDLAGSDLRQVLTTYLQSDSFVAIEKYPEASVIIVVQRVGLCF